MSPSPDTNEARPVPSRGRRETSAFGTFEYITRTGRRLYSAPELVLEARSVDEVLPILRRVAGYVADGYHAAGYLAYEAAPAFDAAMPAHEASEMPLVWFGLYRSVEENPADADVGGADYRVGSWRSSVTRSEYLEAVRKIRALIEAGDTYQVNYTFPMHASFRGAARAWFDDLRSQQPSDHSAYIDTGRFKIASVSPELFFRLSGERLQTKPMKGTSPRGLWYGQDLDYAAALRESEKERAENLMIVDLLRNDMGRISRTGSVRVERLFETERYDTLWQMTSSIVSETDADIPEIFSALFPSGSVTGAPKIRTTEIIRELERFPRGVYCGAIGWWAPGREAEFSVAIRTAVVDSFTATAAYHVGSGITWDSRAVREYEETSLKAAVLNERWPDFELLETILWDGTYFLLDDHMSRLSQSAEYFGFSVPADRILQELSRRAQYFDSVQQKVRLIVSRDRTFRIEDGPISEPDEWRVRLADHPIDSENVFLYHKTTNRTLYDHHKVRHPDAADVILWNTRGEITESTIANVAVELDGKWITPPINCGLLPGVMRAHLLQAGEIAEGVITLDDLERAESIMLINSLRRRINVRLVTPVSQPADRSERAV